VSDQLILTYNLPKDWEVKKIKFVFDERKEFNDPVQTEILISLTHDRGVILHSEKGDIGNKEKDDLSKYKIVHPGDIVVNSMNVIIGSSGLSNYYGLVSPVYYMLKKKREDYDKKYFHYLFRSLIFQKSLVGVGNGILEHRMRVPMDKLGSHFIPLPPAQEQNRISHHLDKKTSQIDSLINKIEKKIELLKEQRTSLINQYVTKGLDPNVEMKDSGIEWIGEIPKHWKLSRIKYLALIISKGTTPSTVGEDLVETGDVRFLKSENIVDGNVTKYPEFFITNETDEVIKRSRLKPNDVLVVIAGAMVGKTAILDSSIGPANTNQAVSFIRLLDSSKSTLIYRWMSSEYVKRTVQTNSVVSAQPNLSMESLGNFYIPVPPVDEWNEIHEFLGEKNNKIELLENLELKKILYLKEYRQSLISSVVTGKVRVTEDMI
jgi:type I restriction enzyme S subunit